MIKQLTSLVALAIGAFMVLSTLSTASGVIPTLLEKELGIVIPLTPVLVSILFAYLLYRFATRIEFDESAGTSDALLLAGSKLFGFYLLLQGLTQLMSMPYVLTRDNPDSLTVVPALLICILYFGLSYLLIKRTIWLVNLISKEG